MENLLVGILHEQQKQIAKLIEIANENRELAEELTETVKSLESRLESLEFSIELIEDEVFGIEEDFADDNDTWEDSINALAITEDYEDYAKEMNDAVVGITLHLSDGSEESIEGDDDIESTIYALKNGFSVVIHSEYLVKTILFTHIVKVEWELA